MRGKSAFTLVELLVVILIVCVVVMIGFSTLSSSGPRGESRRAGLIYTLSGQVVDKYINPEYQSFFIVVLNTEGVYSIHQVPPASYYKVEKGVSLPLKRPAERTGKD